MSEFDNKLNRHIDKVIALQNSERDRMLSLDELKELDLSLGMTENEWKMMMEKADKNVELAQNHFYYKNYRDAYSVAESAVSVNPYLTQALIIMADSALKIYETEDDEDFLAKAEKHAKDVLKQAPAENRAVEILSVLNTYKTSERKEKKKLLKYGIIGGSILIIILSIVLFKPKKEKPINNTVKFELIDAEENANAAWAQVENVTARRDKLIPQLFSAVKINNQELKGLIDEVKALKSKSKTLTGNEKIAADADLQNKYQKITALINSQKTSDAVSALMIQVEGSFNRIAVEGKRYNETVKKYNVLVKKYGAEYPQFKIKSYFNGL
ncbi:MAG: hypothetical protein GXO80_04525 [Chlorobi bacterium]|nr:hypothetical protein [Chlorobiota bacterium]